VRQEPRVGDATRLAYVELAMLLQDLQQDLERTWSRTCKECAAVNPGCLQVSTPGVCAVASHALQYCGIAILHGQLCPTEGGAAGITVGSQCISASQYGHVLRMVE
jgi:hypothetical protein